MALDADALAERYRPRLIDTAGGRVFISRIRGTQQERDLTAPPNCGGFGRVRHFRRHVGNGWPDDPLPNDPATSFLGGPPTAVLRAQVFQVGGCNMRCWYCFVPDQLLQARRDRGAWFTAADLLDRYLAETDRPNVIDLSGGNPDLVPEWPLWMAREIQRRGMESGVYLWSDDSLSSGYISERLSEKDARALAEMPNSGRVGCFKGYSAKSFAFNTNAAPCLFDRQFEIMGRLVSWGFDVYGYVTLTTPNTARVAEEVRDFMDRLQRIHPNLPLRTIPLRICAFTPTRRRLNKTREEAMMFQQQAVEAWLSVLEERFSAHARSMPVHLVPLD